MTDSMTETVEQLVREFQEKAHLSETDAYRSAFCAMAFNRGWSQVRIARYMGITRARVGQRMAKFQWYTERYQMPVLAKLLKNAKKPSSDMGGTPVQFEAKDWEDRDFARGLLEQFS